MKSTQKELIDHLSQLLEKEMNLAEAWHKLTEVERQTIHMVWTRYLGEGKVSFATLPFRDAHKTWVFLLDYPVLIKASRPQKKHFQNLRRKLVKHLGKDVEDPEPDCNLPLDMMNT